MSLDQPVVVEPQQCDHVAHVLLVLDPPRRPSGLVGEHRMVADAALRVELVPDVLGEAEVGGVVAVQVADLPPADAEGELAAALY